MRVLASGSSGNAYVLDNILIECGISYDRILKLNNYKKIKYCIGSHSHGDHFKYAREIMSKGIRVYASAGTFRQAGIGKNYFASSVRAGGVYEIGDWTVECYEAEHDADEPLYFVFEKENERILFSTDNAFIHERHEGLTEIYLEANYDEELLEQNIGAGLVPDARTQAILGHMSLQTAENYLCSLDLSKCRKITLLHLSNRNSHEAEFIKHIEKKTGIPTYGGLE